MLALLGLHWIAAAPEVLAAVSPHHAVRFLATGGLAGYLILGSVFLVVTGGEALYADMGHFGKRPIRLMWFAVVLPAVLINYFGQGAMLLRRHERRAPHVLQPGARLGAVPAGRAGHGGGGHRVAGGDRRRLLADLPGAPARLHSARRRPPLLGGRGRDRSTSRWSTGCCCSRRSGWSLASDARARWPARTASPCRARWC